MGSLPPVSQGVVSTQLEHVRNDRPAATEAPPPAPPPEPAPPPPADSGRGRAVDTSA